MDLRKTWYTRQCLCQLDRLSEFVRWAKLLRTTG